MPDIYSEGDFDIAGFAVGVVELRRATDPVRAKAGDVLIGLPSSGVHSNGFSLVRRIISTRKIRLDRGHADLGGETLGSLLLEPTRIYAKPIVKLLRHYRVKKVVSTMAHITGGGLSGNLPRMLPPTLDAVIDVRTWEVPAIFDFLQRRGDVEQDKMYRVFNMGIGMVAVVSPSALNSLQQSMAEEIWVVGELVSGEGRVKLT